MSIKSLWKEASADFEKTDALGKLKAGAKTVFSTAAAGLGIESAVQGDYISAAAAIVAAVASTYLARVDLGPSAKHDNSGPGGMR